MQAGMQQPLQRGQKSGNAQEKEKFHYCRVDAEGGTRTLTGLRPADFKSATSAIPPPRLDLGCKELKRLDASSQSQALVCS